MRSPVPLEAIAVAVVLISLAVVPYAATCGHPAVVIRVVFVRRLVGRRVPHGTGAPSRLLIGTAR